jgi:hypothetical protein
LPVRTVTAPGAFDWSSKGLMAACGAVGSAAYRPAPWHHPGYRSPLALGRYLHPYMSALLGCCLYTCRTDGVAGRRPSRSIGGVASAAVDPAFVCDPARLGQGAVAALTSHPAALPGSAPRAAGWETAGSASSQRDPALSVCRGASLLCFPRHARGTRQGSSRRRSGMPAALLPRNFRTTGPQCRPTVLRFGDTDFENRVWLMTGS